MHTLTDVKYADDYVVTDADGTVKYRATKYQICLAYLLFWRLDGRCSILRRIEGTDGYVDTGSEDY